MAQPIRTRRSNLVYLGDGKDIADAWVERRPGEGIFLEWRLTDDERATIAAGGVIRLGILSDRLPPTNLTAVEPVELSEEGAALRDRAIEALRQHSTTGDVPSGWWLVSGDVLQRLTKSGALDIDDSPEGIPTLFGRPLQLLSSSVAYDEMTFETKEPARPRLVQ